MSGSIRVIDLPDMGTVTDASSFVVDKGTATGRFMATALKTYCTTTTLPEAPSTNTPYGRMNGAWTPVLGDAPSNSLPYARMNAAWSPVVPEAPLTASIYGRGSAGWVPVMPITGGTISGNFGATGNITSGFGVYANSLAVSSSVGYEWVRYIQAGTGNHIDQHRAGWWDQWDSGTGMRTWIGPSNAVLMSLDGTGNLGVLGAVTSPAFWVEAGSFGFVQGGVNRAFYFLPTYLWLFDTTSHNMVWHNNGVAFWQMRASDNFCFNQLGPVGGLGAYLNSSDRRTKTGITPTTKGLAEVLQLVPVAFTRADPATGAQEEIGFIAQDVQPIVPEAVWTAGIALRDGTGGLDSAEPTLALSESTLTALNVNAIKELNDLITTLTARVTTLEAP